MEGKDSTQSTSTKKDWPRWAEGFLAALRNKCSVSHACESVGIERSTPYHFRKKSPDFAAAWDDAWNKVVDTLEASAMKRAIAGAEEPVFYKGKECGRVRKYETALTIFMLKKNRPEKYADQVADLGQDVSEVAKAIAAAARAMKGSVDTQEESAAESA